MKPNSVFACFLFPLALFGQWSGRGTLNGISFSYETKLEPAAPGIANTGGGLLIDGNVARRHFCDFTSNRYFGYDLTLEVLSESRYQLRVAPLTMSPQRIQALFANDVGWTPFPMPKHSAVAIVRPGDTIAMDLFVNPSTGQKVVDYITIERGSSRKLTAGNAVRTAPPLSVTLPNGTALAIPQPPGKVYAVLFLLTNCPHCGPCSEMLSKLQTEYGTQRLQVVGAALNQQLSSSIPRFVLDHKLNYPVGTVNRESALRFLDTKPESRLLVPVIVLLDRDGIIRYQSSPETGQSPDEARLRVLLDSM